MDKFGDFGREEFLRKALGFGGLMGLHDVLDSGEGKKGKEFEVFLNIFVCCAKEELGKKFSSRICEARERTLPGKTPRRSSSCRPTTRRFLQTFQIFHPYL